MKRTALVRRSPLKRRHALRSRPKPVRVDEPGRVAWKEPHAGYCQCGCHRWTHHLERHHIVAAAKVRELNGDVWDLRNSVLLHEHCHAQHTNAFRRLSLGSVPTAAFAFAVELMGEDRAMLYMARFYCASRRAPV